MKEYRIGIIGCGFISHAHMKGWSKIDNAQIIAVSDIDINKARTRGGEFGIDTIYSDYLEMMEKEKFDIVDIITPVHAHKEIVPNVASQGCNILCEKPFAGNIKDAEEMVAACDKNEVKIMICQTNRWHPWFRTIKQELQKGTIGTPYYSVISQRVSFAIPQGKENRVALIEDQPFYKEAEQLVLLEQGCHFIDIFRYFFGEALSVSATVKRISPHVKGDDLAILIIEFPGLTAMLEDSWVSSGSEKTSITLIEGEKGSLYFGGTSGAAPHRTTKVSGVDIRMSDNSVNSIPQDARNYYYNAFEQVERHFIECLEMDKEPITSGIDNLKSLEIVFAAYKSSEISRAVKI